MFLGTKFIVYNIYRYSLLVKNVITAAAVPRNLSTREVSYINMKLCLNAISI